MGGASNIPKPSRIRHTHTYVNIPNHPKGQTMLQKGSSQNHTPHHSEWSQNHISTKSITYIHTPTRLGIPPVDVNAESEGLPTICGR